MTDLEKFVELYKSFGIECKVNEYHKGYYITLSPGSPSGLINTETFSDKFTGDEDESGTTMIDFDKEGKFIEQVFW